jgi:hypothetical protein
MPDYLISLAYECPTRLGQLIGAKRIGFKKFPGSPCNFIMKAEEIHHAYLKKKLNTIKRDPRKNGRNGTVTGSG